MNEPLYTLDQLNALLDRQGDIWHDLQRQIDALFETYEYDHTYSYERETKIAALREEQERIHHIGYCIDRAIEVWYTHLPVPNFRKLRGPEPLKEKEIDTINQFAMDVAAEGVTR